MGDRPGSVVYIIGRYAVIKECVKAWGSIVGPFLPAPDRTPKGGETMFLTLYHDEKEPYKVYNVIKATIDNFRTIAVTCKYGRHIKHSSYRHEKDYQRLTIEVD